MSRTTTGSSAITSAMRVGAASLVRGNEALNSSGRVTQLYRDICREMPRILNQYDMGLTPVEGRAAIQHHFRRFASLQDPRAINMMVSRGYMELDETLQQYKQRPHVLRILKPYHHDEERPSDFLTKFFEGTA